MILEDQYKQACDQLKEKKESLEKTRPTTAKVVKDKTAIKTMENQLDKHLVKYNNLQSENKNLRHEIDTMRKEMRNQVRVNVVYNKDIKVANEKAKNLNRTTYQG